jgi:hypothetical protein
MAAHRNYVRERRLSRIHKIFGLLLQLGNANAQKTRIPFIKSACISLAVFRPSVALPNDNHPAPG